MIPQQLQFQVDLTQVIKKIKNKDFSSEVL